MAQTFAGDQMEKTEARVLRRHLRPWLQQKHGNLPKTVLDRITACNDLQRLEQAAFNAPKLAKLEDLEL